MTARDPDYGETIARWSDDPNGLSLEECARRSIEAVAGLVISGDMFGTNNNPDELFCTCVEMYHQVAGTGKDLKDSIAVYFSAVEFREGTYPLIGHELLRMHIRRLSDGNTAATWGTADHSQGDQPFPGVSPLDGSQDVHSSVSIPMALGEIPAQDEGDVHCPSFLMLRDPGAGWQIWRRFTSLDNDGRFVFKDGYREESYVMVYPVLSSDMNWRFRVYGLPGGQVRVEMNLER